jgi:hypothetical protein
MGHVIEIPRRFNASYSWLGCRVRSRIGDDRRAEAFFILALASIAAGTILLHYLIWFLLQPYRSTSLLLYVWGVQAGVWLLILALCVYGFKPSFTVRFVPEGLDIAQGARSLLLPREDIRGITTVSALRFHRHHRLYAGTQAFVNKMEIDLLVLHTFEGHVVLSVPIRQHDVIKRHLSAQPIHQPYAEA